MASGACRILTRRSVELGVMRRFAIGLFAISALVVLTALLSVGQVNSAASSASPSSAASSSGLSLAAELPAEVAAAAPVVEPLIALQATSTINLSSELGGAFHPPVKCDADGNLYIRRFALNRPRGPVIKIDSEGKPAALFDPMAFSELALDRVDAFSPDADGGIYQIAQSGITKPRMYVLHYSSDGSPSSPSRLEADFEVYTFAAFADGSFLVSGTQRDPMDKNDHGHGVTAVFSADGRELAPVTFQEPKKGSGKTATESGAKAGEGAPSQPVQTVALADTTKMAGALDLKDAERSRDGNLYVMRASSQAPVDVDVVSPSGKIVKTLKIAAPLPGGIANSFHVSENRLALLFRNGGEQSPSIEVVDGETGRKISAYSVSSDLGAFACYSANDGVFTFLKHGDGNVIEMIRAEAQ